MFGLFFIYITAIAFNTDFNKGCPIRKNPGLKQAKLSIEFSGFSS